MSKQVSCIIPAFNEGKTIAGVIKTALKTPEISEVIVVDDGSKDSTSKRAKKFKNIKVIELEKNYGKGFAVIEGVKASKNKFVLLLDADLIHLKPHHLSSLIQPVLNGTVDMTIADIKSALGRPYSINWYFSGQRCLPKKLIKPLRKEIRNSGYGIEVILNERLKKKRVVVIPLITDKKSLHVIKPGKQKDWFQSYIKESWEVFQKIVSMKKYSLKKKAKEKFLEELSSYLKVNIDKIREYLKEQNLF